MKNFSWQAFKAIIIGSTLVIVLAIYYIQSKSPVNFNKSVGSFFHFILFSIFWNLLSAFFSATVPDQINAIEQTWEKRRLIISDICSQEIPSYRRERLDFAMDKMLNSKAIAYGFFVDELNEVLMCS